MAIVVRDAGANAGHVSLNVSDRQCLLELGAPHLGCTWEHHLLLYRIGDARWVVLDTDNVVEVIDMTQEVIVPVARNSVFPAECRPLLALPLMTDAEMEAARARGRQLADVLGVATNIQGAIQDAHWIFSDPSHSSFSAQVPAEYVQGPGFQAQGAVALVNAPARDGELNRYTVCERVADRDLPQWLALKREGAGRDPRLLGGQTTLDHSVPTFREAFRQSAASSSKNTTPLASRGTVDALRFEGTPAVDELGEILAGSNIEPQEFTARFLERSGLGSHSALGREYQFGMYALWCLLVLDKLDISRLRCAEHLSRRLLQIDRAVKGTPGRANFDGLEFYMRHTEGGMGHSHTPAFDKYVGEVLRGEALVSKNRRLAQEEAEAAAKKREKKKEKGAGKGDDKQE